MASNFSWTQFWTGTATSVVSFYVGLRAARYQADVTRQRSEKLAAAALRTDLERLALNLGPSANSFGASFYGMTFEAPTLHRWSEPLVMQLALADARIVGGCMELDRELANFAAVMKLFHLAEAERRRAQDEAKRLKQSPIDDDATMEAIARHVIDRQNAEQLAVDAKEPVSDALRMMRDHHAKAQSLIAEMIGRTSAIADAPDREFLQLPEEAPRPYGTDSSSMRG